MPLKILLCEDYPAIRALLTATLESDDYEVVTAGDGDACVECWRSERPEIVVLDVKMPGRSGPEVLSAMRRDADHAATPVIVLTGSTEAAAREEMAVFGPERYLTKPFSPLALIAAVEEIGDRLNGGTAVSAGEVARLALNEARFRRSNERAARVTRQLRGTTVPEDLLLLFVCECGTESCTEELRLTRAEYERVRADATHFAVVPGHERAEVDRVVAYNERFLTVKKLPGRAEEIAVETDPRAG